MLPKVAEEAHQGSSSAVPPPAVDVQLLSSTDAITAILSQPTDSTISGDAAINDCQMQEVELALQNAGVAVLPGSCQDLLSIFNVWPKADAAMSVQNCSTGK